MELKTANDLIFRLKGVREERKLSLPDIMEMIEKNNDYISMTTLRRVFSDGSESLDFSYDKTIRPIVNALLSNEQEPPAAVEIDLLKAVIRQKNETIDLLNDRININRSEYDKRLAFLRDQIEKKDRRMDEKDEIIKKLMAKCLG